MVAATGNDHREKRPSGEGHAVRFLNYGRKAEHFGVHFQGGYGAGGDNDRAETVKDRFDSDGGVKAGEMKNRIWDGGGVGFIGLKD